MTNKRLSYTPLLRERRVFKGKLNYTNSGISKSEYSEEEISFLKMWQSDAVLSIALHSPSSIHDFPQRILKYISKLGMRALELEEAYISFFDCWSQLDEERKRDKFWEPVISTAKDLSFVENQKELVFPKLQDWILTYNSKHKQTGVQIPRVYQERLFVAYCLFL